MRCLVVLYECVVFFFFKQKTAYEMRISDWSSDVCSSDLGGSYQRQTANEYQHLSNPGSQGSFDFSGLAPILGPDVGRIYYWNYSEIGRASCRARVCQYV